MMGKGVVSFGEEEPKVGKTVRLPVTLWNEMGEALEFERNLRRAAKIAGNFSLNDIAQQFLQWAVEQYWKENGPKPEKMTDREAILRALDARVRAATGEGGKKK
jgi:hypothetical protein